MKLLNFGIDDKLLKSVDVMQGKKLCAWKYNKARGPHVLFFDPSGQRQQANHAHSSQKGILSFLFTNMRRFTPKPIMN